MNPHAEPNAAPEPVDEASLRRSLEQVKQSPLDPAVGLFGPGSMFWEVNRHTIVYFLGAVQSVQMQLVHPWIGTAVFEHSKIMSDPRRRAQLTYRFLWSFIYGDLDLVVRSALGLYRVHGRVVGRLAEKAGRHEAGESYAANEVHALLWVHVTAFVGRIRFYEWLVRELSTDEKDRFVREARLYAVCFGIPESMHPQSWQEVEAYLDAMLASEALARNRAGTEIRRFLERRIPWPLRAPIWNLIAQTLPDRVKELLELPPPSAVNRARARRTARALAMLQRLLPAKLAYVPAYHEALRRIAGEDGPDATTRVLNRLILGAPRLVSRDAAAARHASEMPSVS